MANKTLLEQSNVINETPLRAGIIQTIARESAVLELLPFIEIKGNAYSYLQNTKLGEVAFRDVGESYDTDAGEYKKQTEDLHRLGAIVEVDRFVEMTQNINNVRAEETANKSKAIANTFTNTFFNGSTGKGFEGLVKRVEKKQVIKKADEALESEMIHELLDTVQGGADVMFMNKRTRRAVTALFGSQGAWIQSGQDAFGRPIQYFGDVRIAVVADEYLADDSIYAVKFGIEDGVAGIQVGGGLQALDNGLRDVTYQTLIEWYTSFVVGNSKGVARLHGFDLKKK